MKGKLLVDDCGYLVAGGRPATCSFFRKSDFTAGKRCYCRRDYFCGRVGNVATWNVQKKIREVVTEAPPIRVLSLRGRGEGAGRSNRRREKTLPVGWFGSVCKPFSGLR